jgi:hypothetical protein
MRAIDIDQVETGLLRPNRRRAMPSAQVTDILAIHRPRLHGIVGEG